MLERQKAAQDARKKRVNKAELAARLGRSRAQIKPSTTTIDSVAQEFPSYD